MNTEKERFEQMLEALLKFVDTINASHSQGVCFGAGNRLFPAEIHTIAAIGRNPGTSLTKLAGELCISKPTLSERIRKLVAKGFVKKEKNPEDQKAVTLWLTEKGETADHHHTLHHENMYAIFCRYFGEETPRKIDLFTKTFNELNRFGKNVDEPC